ncbi:MAG TPA: phosphatidate cytidylyltransferase [Clostridiaceae bacterium]|nr:phosphatidate cytidylyltransferase [Clostridiaceae bacterium]
MKTRIISATVGIILLLIVVFAPKEVLAAGMFILAVIGLHEFYSTVATAGYRPVKLIGYLACIPIFIIGFTNNEYNKYTVLSVFAILAVLMGLIVFKHERYNIIDISLTTFGIMYVPFLFLFIILTRNLENGFYFMWMIFIGAWVTDTFAYFTGVFLGKRKLIPPISPKKTVEGSIGGIAGCVAVMTLYGVLVINSRLGNIPLYHYIIISLLCGIISQVGDLAASAIKRYVKVKDYGKIMPGHGGVLDRFDSILFVAPVVYFYISFFII